jgi:hypothetical protein
LRIVRAILAQHLEIIGLTRLIGISVSIQKWANWAEIKAFEKFYRRHMVNIPRIKFFV